MSSVPERELRHLERCVELAEEALAEGDEPFGTVLVAADGTVLMEDRNRVVATGDPTAHPELAVARWAAVSLDPEQRRTATVYTSGEHCAMCSAGHGWAGLGRIVYVHSSAQLDGWRAELGLPPGAVRSIPVQDVVPGLPVQGPVPELEDRVRDLHRRHALLHR